MPYTCEDESDEACPACGASTIAQAGFCPAQLTPLYECSTCAEVFT